MQHTKFRGSRSTSSGEDFGRVITIYGNGGHLGYVTQMPGTIFRSPTSTHRGSTQKLALIDQAVWEMFEIVNGRQL